MDSELQEIAVVPCDQAPYQSLYIIQQFTPNMMYCDPSHWFHNFLVVFLFAFRQIINEKVFRYFSGKKGPNTAIILTFIK